ncbi:MAG: hypothetical protein Q9M21_04290 [Mariprofundaceae bacterium]|nr:hypothetical protein [Mariprofundaceae bacterium]
MAITYRIDSKQKIVFTHVDSVVDGKNILEHQDRLRNDPSFEPNMYELMDCHEIESVNLNSIHKSKLTERSPWGSDAKRAIVVPSALIFGFLRIFQTFMNGTHGEISIFYSKDSAITWLGIKTTNK